MTNHYNSIHRFVIFLMIYDTNRGIIRFGDLSTGLLTTYCNAHPSVRLGRSLCAGLPLFSDIADDRHEPRRLLRHGGHWSKGAHPRAPLSPGQSRRPARARHPAHRADDGRGTELIQARDGRTGPWVMGDDHRSMGKI